MDANGILGFFGLLAIIIVSIFILALIVDWLLCVVDGRDGIFFKKKNKSNEASSTVARPEIIHEEPITPAEAPAQEPAIEEEFGFDYNKAEEEQKLAEAEFEEFDFSDDEALKARSDMIDNRVDDDDDFSVFDETTKDEDDVITKSDEEYDAMIAEIGTTVMSRRASTPLTEDDSQENVEDIVIPEETVATQDTEVMEEKMDDIRQSLEQEIARLQQELIQKQQENEILRTTAEKEKNELLQLLEQKAEDDDEGESKVIVSGSVEELEERLSILKERLKVNEKDLRLVKKEFMPLRRVKRTLEKDEKKLRRREALVAKQKVVLYGVNNYVDLDEEKAKKLNEELDLLEGLKFSVAHCHEVMEKNKERYPILENTYNILVQTNSHIKQDIEEVEASISALKSQNVATSEVASAEEISANDSVQTIENISVEEFTEIPVESIDAQIFETETPVIDTDFDFFNTENDIVDGQTSFEDFADTDAETDGDNNK